MFYKKNIKSIKDSKKLPQPNMKENQEGIIFLALYWIDLIKFYHLNNSNLK